ncbi:DUF3750 domain-containing protein [Rouxiella badensis]|jgi:hypothetical protein|uniref:DUF3750 domain-containing protein n=1 Tax=Rouxiella badensis TaxID=1646377 RepID=A0A1X0WDM6_9GAMM|nr:DUF3750 domain-containing protein [Rouxiella badensis]MCC3703158.1 DUF3750 domain-containing protein [Rouxiella badensis]MCC3720663.1 DUF3750 domain-containing protein [Rouxiella badensis]MCC3730467.1 DUF3750 domain-containing protein [Rouxiella badensis]MCC3734678.1 DUF3750 domain-containing protein [Rouxiella badensis]MCC3741800.1 DUF3750 domain-containing protein [Rouxiella badensis]
MNYLKWFSLGYIVVLLLSFGYSYARASQTSEAPVTQSWSTARRDSSNLAPDPLKFADTAIVEVYAAKTYGWRGLFAVHTWIIFKRAGETQFTRYDVIGWRSDDVVRRNYAIPDGYWFGAKPHILVDHRGPQAEAMIPQIEAAIKSYPYPQTYHAWPGPNSNTFIAHIGRDVPALQLDMPSNAIGKDYRPLTHPVGLPPSGKGVQISLLGLLGLNIGAQEGIEINVLGLNLGVNIAPPALRLPFIGSVGDGNTTTVPNKG